MPTHTRVPLTTSPHRAAVGLLTGMAGLIVVAWATAIAVRSLAPGLAVTGVDADVSSFLVGNRRPWLTTVSRAASATADLQVVAALVLALGVAAWVRSRHWRLLWVPGLAGGGALVISVVVKVLTARDRPALSPALVEAYGLAFPSGHALRAIAVYGALAYFAAAAARSSLAGALAWGCAGTLVAAVGFARIYLGAHWLTDVVAGYVIGAVWLGLVLLLTGIPTTRTSRAEPAEP